ncbi:MAG: hypothetical protein RL199_2203 [Pseudomonadota bacterium]
MTTPSAQRIVFVSGLSGAGKSTAVRALEDAGYFCIDNLPAPVIPKVIELIGSSPDLRRLALVVDARDKSFLGQLPDVVANARTQGHEVHLLFLDASDEAILRRFSETRRRHPLAPQGTVHEGIAAERALLADLRAVADETIDTTALTVHELKATVSERYGQELVRSLAVTITSFGFRYGLPPQADIVLDVRFLPNPYFISELRPHPGTTPAVSGWVLAHDVSKEFLTRATDLLAFLLPRYRNEGKSYLTVALGCTGGRHRSVALAEALGAALGAHDVKARVRHRDVERE